MSLWLVQQTLQQFFVRCGFSLACVFLGKFHFLVGHIRCWAVSWIKQLLPAWHHTTELRFHYPLLHKADNQLLSVELVWHTWEEPITWNTKIKNCSLFLYTWDILLSLRDQNSWLLITQKSWVLVSEWPHQSLPCPLLFNCDTEVYERCKNQNLISHRCMLYSAS